MILVCLTLCSLFAGSLLVKIRHEPGSAARCLYGFAIAAMAMCTGFAGIVMMTILQLDPAAMLTPRVLFVLSAVTLGGMAGPLVVDHVRRALRHDEGEPVYA